MINVEIDGRNETLEFPDGTDPKIIDSVVQRDILKIQPSFLQKTKEAVSTFAGDVREGYKQILGNEPTVTTEIPGIQKIQGVSTLGITHPEQVKTGLMLKSEKVLQEKISGISRVMQEQPEFYKGMTPKNVLQRQIEAEKAGTTGEVQPSIIDPVEWATFIIGGGIPGIIKTGMASGVHAATSQVIRTGLEATAIGLAQIPIGTATEELATTEYGKTHPEVPAAFNLIANAATIHGLGKALTNLQATNIWRRMEIPERDLVVQTIEQMKQAQPYGKFKGFSEGQVARVSPEAYEESFAKRMPAESPILTEPSSMKISKALGKENQPEILEKMGFKTEETKIGQIVNDAVTQKLSTAKVFEEKGKTEFAQQATEEAMKNAEIIKAADGPVVEKVVNEALKKVIQPDMLGITPGVMEGKIPSVELPETALEKAARGAKLRKVEAEVAEKQVGIEAKSISQFTKEYKEAMGESGYIKIGGEEVTPKVVIPANEKDISLLEFPLGTLHVADRHPFLKPIIEGNIKATQDTNNWTLRYSDKFENAFDKVEKPGILMKIFGRRGSDIRDVDLMAEGKKPIPNELTEFVNETKVILQDIKNDIIQKMQDNYLNSLSPKQKEYYTHLKVGGDKPKYIREGTINAIEETLKQFEEMKGWGIQDFFPHIFKGKYKYLAEDGHIIASGETAKQAKANFEEYIESNPDTADKTFVFVNEFYDLMTARKTLNPGLVNSLEYLGTKLTRKEFFRLLGRTEKTIKEEIVKAGVNNIHGIKVDMSGIASFQKGTKFSGHFLKRKSSLRGEEADPFKALMSYIFSVGRKLGLEDAKKASYAFADSLPINLQNAKNYVKMQADNMTGRYNIIDKMFDDTIGTRLGMKPFGASRIIAKSIGWEAKLKLGYAPAKTAINRIGGVMHVVLKEGIENYMQGKALLLKKDAELLGKIEKEGHLAGMEQLFTEGGLVGTSQSEVKIWRPLGSYQKAEIKNRSEALAAAYVAGLKKFKGDKDAAWIYALDSARLTQGLYDITSKPVIVRGPILQATYQFKQYLTNEIRFMSTLTPAQWAGYIAGITAIAGTKGALMTIKSIIGISIIGIGLDKVMERLNRKAPNLHRGIFGLVGFDVSAPATWQIPSHVMDWIGAFPKDIISTGEMLVKGLQNNGWTDEDINDYVRQIAPVGYNIFKGYQLLSEGVTKEGSKIMYKGGKKEGIFNLLGSKSVGQSQAADSNRYIKQQRKMLIDKINVVEDKLFRSKTSEQAMEVFEELVELKDIQTPEEMKNLISGLKTSSKRRIMTEEARIFLTLPKKLKREAAK